MYLGVITQLVVSCHNYNILLVGTFETFLVDVFQLNVPEHCLLVALSIPLGVSSNQDGHASRFHLFQFNIRNNMYNRTVILLGVHRLVECLSLLAHQELSIVLLHLQCLQCVFPCLFWNLICALGNNHTTSCLPSTSGIVSSGVCVPVKY